MKKRILSLMAALLCIAMLICFVGCNGSTPTETPTEAPTDKPTEPANGNEDGNNDLNNDHGDVLTETDEERTRRIFNTVKNAYNATNEYEGSYTLISTLNGKESESETTPEGTETESMTAENVISISRDSDNGMILHDELYTEKYGNVTEFGRYTEKYFTDNGEHLEVYARSYSENGGERKEIFSYKYNDADWQKLFENSLLGNTISDFLTEGFGKGFEAESYEELKAAYAKVLPEILEAEKADITDSNGTVLDNTGVSFDISVDESDGTAAVTINISYIISRTYSSRGDYMETLNIENTIYAKDGKLIGLKLINEYSDTNTKGEEVSTDATDMTFECKIDYSFDKELYDSFTDTTATVTPGNRDSHIKHSFDLTVNGNTPYTVDMYLHLQDSQSFSEALDRAIMEYTGIHENEADGYTVEWFTDKACTRPFSVNSITDTDQLSTLTELYVKVTPKPGYAVIINAAEWTYTIPREYYLIFGDNTGERMVVNIGQSIKALRIGEEYSNSHDIEISSLEKYGTETTVYLNGVAIDKSDFSAVDSWPAEDWAHSPYTYPFNCEDGGSYFIFTENHYVEKVSNIYNLMFDW